jgi:hypothetical protein
LLGAAVAPSAKTQNFRKMEITVRIKNVYGEDKIYPVCSKAVTFANLINQKTFTPRDLSNIRLLGYSIKQGVFAKVGGEEAMVTCVELN